MNTDSDVQAYVAALRSANLNISAHQVDALSEFASSAKAAGYWDSLLEVYPFCGDSMAAMQYKLKFVSSVGRTMAWTATDGSTNALCTPRTGMTSNDQSGSVATALNTGLIPSTHFQSTYTIGMAFTSMSSGSSFEMGCYNTPQTSGIHIVSGSGAVQASLSTNTGFDLVSGTTDGLFVCSRQAASGASALVMYRNGVLAASNTTAFVANPTNGFFLMGRKTDSGNGQPTRNRQLFAFVSNLLTTAQVTSMNADAAVLLRNLRRTTT